MAEEESGGAEGMGGWERMAAYKGTKGTAWHWRLEIFFATSSRQPNHTFDDSHKVALEEILQLPLGCRIGEVADVQAATFGGAGENGVVGRLVVLVRDRGIGQSVGNVIDGSGRGVSNLLHGGRHIDWFWMVGWRKGLWWLR